MIRMQNEPGLQEEKQGTALQIPGLDALPGSRKLFIESYGCQMNFADSEIVASIMKGEGFGLTTEPDEADVIFLNTCSIRENAELRVRKRLTDFQKNKAKRPGLLVGVLGCMAERLKSKFLDEEKLVDLVIGPDAYRDLPRLMQEAESGQRAINVLLSREETYADLSPLRFSSNGISAFVSIMRGCNNMCSFCVVPFTRGRERSRDLDSILGEVSALSARGFKEVTLLGQNVDSYSGKNSMGESVSFATLLGRVAETDRNMRVRFSTSHPKDITDEVLYTMAAHENICKYIHLPIQSGNSRILERMNRSYDRDWYLGRIEAIRRILPGAGISTDVITGFCSETDTDHADTLSLMDEVKFDYAYMFKYSERPGTPAAKMADDVPEETKGERLNEVIALQRKNSHERLLGYIGKTARVLIEGVSKKSASDLSGRNDQNAMVVFPAVEGYRAGMYADVKIKECTSATLLGTIVA